VADVWEEKRRESEEVVLERTCPLWQCFLAKDRSWTPTVWHLKRDEARAGKRVGAVAFGAERGERLARRVRRASRQRSVGRRDRRPPFATSSVASERSVAPEAMDRRGRRRRRARRARMSAVRRGCRGSAKKHGKGERRRQNFN
jgi:hypothetical protein